MRRSVKPVFCQPQGERWRRICRRWPFAEGSFGTWLLAEDVTFEDAAFGLGGRATLLHSRGLSVTVKEEVLERLATAKIDLRR